MPNPFTKFEDDSHRGTDPAPHIMPHAKPQTRPLANPFTPNFGQVPQVLAGRKKIRYEMIEALENPWGHPNQTTIIIGARGSGKTALLRSMVTEAEQRGWIAASVSCINGMLEDIIQQAQIRGQTLLKPKSKKELSGISIAGLGGIELTSATSSAANWRTQISGILNELAENDAGLLILVDEVDPDLDEMIQLTSIYQQFIGENRKIALFMGGLPHRISALLTNKSVSFLRRSTQHKLESLSPEEVADAFRETVEEGGKDITNAALADAVKGIDGFPYMLQLVGYRAWQEAANEEVVKEKTVNNGVKLAEEDLRSRVLQATLDELSANDLAFLDAMLDTMPEDEESVRVDDIESRLQKSSAHVSVYRRRLLEQGVISDLGRKRLKFALPGLRTYLPEYLENNL